jgi:hypothetical protein
MVFPMRKGLLGIVAVLPALLAFGNGERAMSAADVSRALMAQMNGTAAGHITKRVTCRQLAHATAGDVRYACVLTGSLASTRAVVTVHGTSWRADFAPLHG